MRKNKKFFSCKGCGNSLEFAIEEEENIYICPVCNCFNNFIASIVIRLFWGNNGKIGTKTI